MVDPLSQQLIQEIGKTSVGQSPQPSTVSPQDAASFQTMVGGNVEGDTAVQGVVASESTTAAAMPEQDLLQSPLQKPSLGDRILQGLENSQSNIQAARDKVATEVQGDSSISKMYELQLQVSQLATNQQIIGQVGSKTSQGIQTLLKGQ